MKSLRFSLRSAYLTPSLAALGLSPSPLTERGKRDAWAPSGGEVNQGAAEQRPYLTGFARTLVCLIAPLAQSSQTGLVGAGLQTRPYNRLREVAFLVRFFP